jgi:uncharacterized protein YeaO (DUF488 family)
MINIKPVYEKAAQDDGLRILVDRLWPRGLCPVKERVDMWLLDAAPSEGLRNWQRRNPRKWGEFREKYRREMADKQACLDIIWQSENKGPVTLLYAARDKDHNFAAALRELLELRSARA